MPSAWQPQCCLESRGLAGPAGEPEASVQEPRTLGILKARKKEGCVRHFWAQLPSSDLSGPPPSPHPSLSPLAGWKASYWPHLSFPGHSLVKNLPANAGDAGDVGSIPGLGRSPGGGSGNPLQYPCMKKPMDRGAWQATVHRVAKSWTQLSTHACRHWPHLSTVAWK